MWFPQFRTEIIKRIVATLGRRLRALHRERCRPRRPNRRRDHGATVVELLESRILLTVDLGDAPSPYPTTLAENGARHTDTGPTLGAARDSELDGAHSANATADGADEDGVTFGTIRVGMLGATATVTVAGAPSGAKLDAWIDFNGDGNWGGPGEQIAASVAVVTGVNVITFDVPSNAKDGTTFARFRLSTAGNLGPEGLAANGEVEDYAVTLLPPAAAPGVFDDPTTIATGVNGVVSVVSADMDGDGDMDLLSASYSNDKIAWYENDGSQNFTAHTISLAADYAGEVFAADLDGDGDLDVLSSSRNDDKIAWYKNDGNQNFTAHTITTTADRAYSVFAADVDGDGDIDVLSASSIDDKIAWYENNGSEVFTAHTITTAANGAVRVTAADVDGDGDLDVLSASVLDHKIAWYENNGSQSFTAHTITSTAYGTRSVATADVDGDGDLDVLSASFTDDKIAWYENDGNQNFTLRTISTAADGAWSVVAADVDGDGDMDVVSTSGNDKEITWYENDGSQNFTPHTKTVASLPYSTIVADLDGDGDLDFVTTLAPAGTIVWFESIGFDFGDAPASYPTTLAENGARHVGIGPTLGTTRDRDQTGTHSANADGDDTTGGPDDEDGVTFETIMVGALGAQATVHVQNAPSGAKLDAWIDFNGDGVWGGPGEQIASNLMVVNGDNSVTFDVPSWAADGTTFARFRLSTTGNLAPEGEASNGEVEDYAVTLQPSASAGGLFSSPNVITSGADSARSVFAADMDGDGDMDVLSASGLDDKIAWYENNGSQTFSAHTISTGADKARMVIAADVDGDGDLDVLSASTADDTIAWYENNGSQSFTVRTISEDPDGAGAAQGFADGAVSIFAADVDGDGDLDILSASFYDDTIAWYENDGSQTFTARTISTTADGAYSVSAADVDGDGDMDVLSASALDDKIAWYENNGSETFTVRTVSTAANGAISVFAADVDGDGDMDILSASVFDDKIAWYENNGSQSFTVRTISTTADGARWVFAADIDGDGDLDVLSASDNDDKVAWYENNGSQAFTARTISTAADGAYSVFVADVDGDGDLDVLSASRYDDKITWYQQQGGFDFGDAPAPYPTTATENGARHGLGGPTLGANRDRDFNGAHSANADADDTTGLPDDDGVTLGTIRVGALGATATVNVQDASSGARLDAWIDFNGDGSWSGPMEQIASNVAVAEGNTTITFDVPSWARNGVTYARFRLSTAGNLGPEGAAADGEVEDYAITIDPPVAGSGVFAPQSVVFAPAPGAIAVFAADVDGDGDMDMLSASFDDDTIAWYENNGSESFTRRTISSVADGAFSVFAADIDGDGDLDVLSTSTLDSTIAWYENNGSQTFTRRIISTPASAPRSVFAADVDGDGDMDVLAASAGSDRIAWYENDGSENFSRRTISTAADGASSVYAADVDGDGDIDVLSASIFDDKIAWYENDGSQSFTEHTISTAAEEAHSVFAADVDGDGDMDVLSASGFDDTIAWYENDGSQNFTVRIITEDPDTSDLPGGFANAACSVFAADVDGDGDLDVLSASYDDDKIAWYENDGSQNFTARTISTAADGARSVFAADVDGDGDLDVLSASRTDGEIAWYENRNAPRISAFDTSIAYVEGAAPRILDTNVSVTDLDTSRFNGGVLTISLTANAEAADRLEFRQITRLLTLIGSNVFYRGTFIGTFTGGIGTDPLVITFNANATASSVETVLRNVTYRSVSSNPSILARTVQITLTDGTGTTSNLPTKTINVSATIPMPVNAPASALVTATNVIALASVDPVLIETFPHTTNPEVLQVLTELNLVTPDDTRAGHLLPDHPTAGHGGDQSRLAVTLTTSVESSRRHPASNWKPVREHRAAVESLLDDLFARFDEWV